MFKVTILGRDSLGATCFCTEYCTLLLGKLSKIISIVMKLPDFEARNVNHYIYWSLKEQLKTRSTELTSEVCSLEAVEKWRNGLQNCAALKRGHIVEQ